MGGLSSAGNTKAWEKRKAAPRRWGQYHPPTVTLGGRRSHSSSSQSRPIQATLFQTSCGTVELYGADKGVGSGFNPVEAAAAEAAVSGGFEGGGGGGRRPSRPCVDIILGAVAGADYGKEREPPPLAARILQKVTPKYNPSLDALRWQRDENEFGFTTTCVT